MLIITTCCGKVDNAELLCAPFVSAATARAQARVGVFIPIHPNIGVNVYTTRNSRCIFKVALAPSWLCGVNIRCMR